MNEHETLKKTGSARKHIPLEDQQWFRDVYYPSFLTRKEVIEDSTFNTLTIDKILENKPVSPTTIERIQELRKKAAA